jgi:uncharacterized protein YecE (DUF72 family)
MQIHVGTSGYGYKEWKGIFYPAKMQPKEMLQFYAGHLSAVEINYTFYHMPTPGILIPWSEEVPDNFSFVLKAPQVITHFKQLRHVKEETNYLFHTLSLLGDKLGGVLFQFPKSFHANPQVLADFLALLPKGIPCAFEFRSASWFTAEILDLLRQHGCSLCTADTDDDPAKEIISTAPWGYLRLRRSDYTEADLAQWLERILAQKWQRTFVFFKHEDETKGPGMAIRFRELAEA